MDDFIPMSRPYFGQEEIDAVTEVLRSGWITTGPKCKEFEESFAAFIGARQAISLTSATAGLHIVLKALDIGSGDEVVTPSMTFASTVNQIVLAGAKPVFVDCDFDTLMPEASAYAKAITKHTRAIIPVHFAGAPADMDAIEDIAGTIPIIEDAAHAIDTHYKGRHIGGRHTAIFSFHPIKNITTGEGGMVTGNDEALMRRLRLLKFHGIDRDAWKRYGKASDPSYDITEPGFKYNMTDIQAALGLVQMMKIADITRRRTAIAKAYLEGLQGLGLDLPGSPAYAHQHSWHLFVVKLRAMKRSEFMAALAEHGVGYGLHFPACHTLSYIKKLYGAAKLPMTEDASSRIISLPIHPGMEDSQVRRVIKVVREVLA
jgi:UDP-4-amino-4-deoxy-L-arabinose-oxoglutarate aminotransferase